MGPFKNQGFRKLTTTQSYNKLIPLAVFPCFCGAKFKSVRRVNQLPAEKAGSSVFGMNDET